MLIPLWVPWTVTVALLLTAFAAFLGDSSLSGSRPPRWVKRMLWVPGIVALVATGAVTIDRVHVSQRELSDAADQARTQLEDAPVRVSGDRFALEVQRILGHAASARSVTVSYPDGTGGNERVEEYDLRAVSERDSDTTTGPVVCLKVDVHGSVGDGDPAVTIDVDEGSCASS